MGINEVLDDLSCFLYNRLVIKNNMCNTKIKLNSVHQQKGVSLKFFSVGITHTSKPPIHLGGFVFL